MTGTQQPIQVSGGAKGISDIDLKHIQGDIVMGMAKKVENFLFFSITGQGQKDKAKSFREHLSGFVPSITNAEQAKEFRELIDRTKEQGRQPNNALNIAFSSKGLNILGINLPGDTKERKADQINDLPFTQGQRARADVLGDDITKWDPLFRGKSSKLNDEIHGVIIVAASSQDKLQEALESINTTFRVKDTQNASIIIETVSGKVRPDLEDGHEHFGFKDGITQPFIDGLGLDEKIFEKRDSAPSIDPGVILLGRRGDTEVLDAKTMKDRGITDTKNPVQMRVRPAWAMDGSFLVFRKLEQRVPEFNAAIQLLAQDMKISPELLGARLVGRWKSGAPIQNTKVQNASTTDPVKKGDTKSAQATSQDFNFSVTDQNACPFVAHIRKTNPRDDLKSSKIPAGPKDFVIPHRILRRGIQFGDELSDAEKKPGASTQTQRGLLFACYQSSIEDGFEFIQKIWVSNPEFPPRTNTQRLLPDNRTRLPGPGVDPLIGTPKDKAQRSIMGANPNKLDDVTDLKDKEWVVSRGGEYFFSPSIAALKNAPFTS